MLAPAHVRLRAINLPPTSLLDLHAAHPDRYPVLLESAAVGKLGACDILLACPSDELVLNGNGTLHSDAGFSTHSGFLTELDRWWRLERVPEQPSSLPFTGGNVSGRLRADVTPGQAIAAVFPGGTITGCPKVRCMEIIAALEDAPRGVYTGSMGYLNRDGTLDLNILIRTLEMAGDRIVFRAGAGIVADSDPVRELEETRAKARGLVDALVAEASP